MSFIGALAVAGLLIAGVFWCLNNITIKGDDNNGDNNNDNG